MTGKAQIIANLGKEFNRWEDLLTGISDEQATASHLIGDWSIKDIVAHLTAWQQISVVRMEAARQNREPEYPNWPTELDIDSDDNLDKINAWNHEIHRERPWPDVHREWKERYLSFIELGESIPEKDLFDAAKYIWLKENPLSTVLTGSLGHHKEHREPLVALLRKNGKL